MHPEILRVHDIHASIKDVGLEYYTDRLIQDMMGNYFYVEANYLKEGDVVPEHWCLYIKIVDDNDSAIWVDEEPDYREMKYAYRVVNIPAQLAYFVIDCLKLKSMIMNAGRSDYGNGPHSGQLKVIIPAGKKLFGKKLKVAKEIPAELGPVVIERL